MKILIVAEHDNRALKSITHHIVSAASALGDDIDLLVMGHDCQPVADSGCLLPGIKRVLLANNNVYAHQLAENCAALIAEVGNQYDYILIGASTFGKNLLPRAAALLDVAMISDVTQIISPDTFVRPIYAGNVMATVQSADKIKMLSIRSTAFTPVKPLSTANASVQTLTQVITNSLSRYEKQELTRSSRPELSEARIVIAGGRGLKSADNFKLLEAIADQLQAAIGASRAAVDAGFAPNDYQVGQTGKVVAPDLYIAVGISGAIQHLAGMKDSKVIVAINSDPEAPIFAVADYALVGDLFTILPELNTALAYNNSDEKEMRERG
jgi:electron transfer flavoprotein alpha subunit